MNTNSAVNIKPLVLVGTATVLLTSAVNPVFSEDFLIPQKNYQIHNDDIDFQYDYISNFLEISDSIEDNFDEPIIQLKLNRKIKIKIKKPTPLEFISTTDTEELS